MHEEDEPHGALEKVWPARKLEGLSDSGVTYLVQCSLVVGNLPVRSGLVGIRLHEIGGVEAGRIADDNLDEMTRFRRLLNGIDPRISTVAITLDSIRQLGVYSGALAQSSVQRPGVRPKPLRDATTGT